MNSTTIYTEGMNFVDGFGRTVLFSGLNLVCKEKSQGYLYSHGKDFYEKLEQDGHNILRFGLIWDGVEPEPGVYDDEYLGRVKEQLRLAEECGISVFLDMHQDLYSVLHSDGAPEWATMTDGHPYQATAHWSNAYQESAAVNCAFDHFWSNTAASDGQGLVDHYCRMWAHVAAYFADCSNVIGYDIINEPYPGTPATRAMEEAVSNLLTDASQAPGGLPEAGDEWEQLLSLSRDQELLKKFLGALTERIAPIESHRLTPFYRQAAETLRQISPKAILFFEPSYYSNIGVLSGITPEEIGKEGLAYSPHAYDMVVDTDRYDSFSFDRLSCFLDAHRAYQMAHQLPALLGEWGGFPGKDFSAELVRQNLKVIEEYLWSQTYWCWYSNFEASPAAKALVRGYPQAVAGKLLRYGYTASPKDFVLEWIPGEGETCLYLPEAACLTEESFQLTGAKGLVTAIDLSQREKNKVMLKTLPGAEPVQLRVEYSN